MKPNNTSSLSPCYGKEKDEWRDREGWISYEDSLQLIIDASKSIILVEDEIPEV